MSTTAVLSVCWQCAVTELGRWHWAPDLAPRSRCLQADGDWARGKQVQSDLTTWNAHHDHCERLRTNSPARKCPATVLAGRRYPHGSVVPSHHCCEVSVHARQCIRTYVHAHRVPTQQNGTTHTHTQTSTATITERNSSDNVNTDCSAILE